ncbi:MAG TPA: extracellular solute-binding protein [Acidimicrobiales bacterium]|nr:extracellular solute-binding protein [Acidimicrobiales bacterium]
MSRGLSRSRFVASAGVGLAASMLGLLGGQAAPAGASSGQAKGPVDVLYAGSLVTMMEEGIGPAFEGTTGYSYSGFSGGSDALAADIKGRTELADVFISASPAVNATLEGSANGSWVSWYATFASSPLVIGYNPSSSFASQLTSKPWYEVVTEPGFLLGRTNPATDPKGKLAVEALDQAATAGDLPALSQLAQSTDGVYPEETLVGRLQSGQLDAGFFYASEAAAAGIPTISLGAVHLYAQYTVTVLARAPHPRAAAAFVTFFLGHQGRAILRHDGLSLFVPPKVVGAKHVPASLRSPFGLR